MNHPSRAIPLIAIGALLLLPDAFAQSNLTPMQRRLASGFVSHELDERAAAKAPAVISPLGVSGVSGASGVNAPLAPSGANAPLAGPPTSYVPSGKNACQQTFGPNVKVNQNCLNLSDADLQGRGQAQNETAIAADPNHPNHLVAAFNDYRRGDGTCGFAFSLDGGQHWNDALAPVGFTRGSPGFARQYWQANGDPSVAWDTRGNAYLACQSFDRGTPSSQDTDTSSAVYVFRSTQNSGASWNFPGRPATEFFDPAGTGSVLEDKPYMTVDSQVGSPFQDRIYVTWTEFAADGSGYIYEVHSSDYGETFSPRVLVSKDSPVCFNTFGAGTPEGKCNENQDSQPFTGPDGALYVVYNNFNNATSGAQDNRNQILLVKSTDGGASFGEPVKVADYYDLPDCDTYQGAGANPFRSCVPEKGPTSNSVFRATNYPSGAVSPRNSQQVTVSFGSYINQHSNESTGCAPAGFSAAGLNLFTGVKTPGVCANQILLSVSSDAGGTFTGGAQDPRVLAIASLQKTPADAFWQWAAYTRSGTFAVSYYDRQYGDDAVNGFSDVSVSFVSTKSSTARATSSSMPPPTQFSGQFYGDYAGLAAVDDLYPIWMDTRNADLFLCPGTGAPGVPPQLCAATAPNGVLANDQEIFTTDIQK